MKLESNAKYVVSSLIFNCQHRVSIGFSNVKSQTSEDDRKIILLRKSSLHHILEHICEIRDCAIIFQFFNQLNVLFKCLVKFEVATEMPIGNKLHVSII